MSPKAVIFDMDGVIIDSEPLWRKAEIEAFAKFDCLLTEEMCRSTAGLRLSQVIDHWQREFEYSNEVAHTLFSEVHQGVISLIKSKGEAFEGLYELLDYLEKAQLKIGLASGSSYEIIYAVLDKLKIRKYFEIIRSGEDEEYSKPHPQIFIQTAKQLKVAEVDCLVIEDSRNGVIAAKAARMKVVAMPEPVMKDDVIFKIADATVERLLDICRLI